MAEMELVRSQSEHAATLEEIRKTQQRIQEAAVERAACVTGAEWSQWQNYITALEMTEQSQQALLEMSSEKVSRTREKVIGAHKETMKWETFRDLQLNLKQAEEASLQQTEQDERAALRFERGRE